MPYFDVYRPFRATKYIKPVPKGFKPLENGANLCSRGLNPLKMMQMLCSRGLNVNERKDAQIIYSRLFFNIAFGYPRVNFLFQHRQRHTTIF